MPSKGFLVRGTLRPAMGSITSTPRNLSAAANGKLSSAAPVRNRIPPSITVKRLPGTR